MASLPTRIDLMKLDQPFKKLAKSSVTGYDLSQNKFVTLPNQRVLLESDQRWISERQSFNSRRVLLTDKTLMPYYVIKVAEDDLERITYSEQRAIGADKAFLYDYTLLDKTHGAQIVTFETTNNAAGVPSIVNEVIDPIIHAVHLTRYAKADSAVNDAIDYTRSYGFIAGNVPISPDNELLIDGTRYLIEESEAELLTTRIMLIKR